MGVAPGDGHIASPLARSDWATTLEEIDEAGRAFIASGWATYLPGIAFDLYSAVMHGGECSQATEDGIRRFLIASGPPEAWGAIDDFDTPIEPYHGGDPESVSWDRLRWQEFRAEAALRGIAASTPNEVLVMLGEFGLIQRDGVDGWLTVAPVPLLENVIALTPREMCALTAMRLHVQFAPEKRLLRQWLAARSEKGAVPVVISIGALSEAISLPPTAVRTALALLVEDGVVDSNPFAPVLGSGFDNHHGHS
jgi:hypothetical protein